MPFLSAQDSCSWGSMGQNVSHTRICTHHHLPSQPPWECRPPPNPSLIKKLKLSISSHINVDLRPRQSPDTSHNLRWLQTAGGVCWRTRMTSRCLPRTGVTRSVWCGEGSRGPGALSPIPTMLPPHHALDPPGWVPGLENSTRHGQQNARGMRRPSPRARARQLAQAPVPARFMRADPLHRAPGAG